MSDANDDAAFGFPNPGYTSNIRDRGRFGAAAWDWGFTNAAFTGQRLADVDGWLETNWHFLFVEAKPVDWLWPEHNRQYSALKRLTELTGHCVVVLYGENPVRPQVHELEVILPGGPRHQERMPASNDVVVEMLRRWSRHASRCDLRTCTYRLEPWLIPAP